MSDPWHHSHKEWRETLDQARQRGWPPPKKGTNHGVLTLNCPEGDPQCRIKIFSTGSGTENVARTSRKKIQRCPHGSFDDVFDEVEHLLSNVERLLAAAAAELSRRDAETEALALLQFADDPLADAAELLDADGRYDAAAEAAMEFDGRVGELLHLDEAGMTPGELVDAASADIRQAKRQMGDLPAGDRHAQLSARLAVAKEERGRLGKMCEK